MKNWVLWAMAAGFVAGFVIGLVPDAEAQSRPPRTITVQNTTNNTFTSQWVANTDGGILFDGGVEVGDGMRWHGRAEAAISDGGVALPLPANARLCLNADAGCPIYLTSTNSTDLSAVGVLGFNIGSGVGTFVGSGLSGTGAAGATTFTENATGANVVQWQFNTFTNPSEGQQLLAFNTDTVGGNVRRFVLRGDGAPSVVGVVDGGMAYRMEPSAAVAWASDGGVAVPHLNLGGTAAASLPTCNASTAGSIRYDTTNAKHVGCNGSAWTNLY